MLLHGRGLSMRMPPLVRAVTDPLLERVPVPIYGGPNRGRWWSLVSAGSGHCSGLKEARRLRLLASVIRPGDVVWDVGAHHGYVALLAWQRVGATGEVHAFEPSPRNRRLMQRHLRWNGAANVQVHPCALGASDRVSRFGGTGTSKTLALGGGDEMVQVRTGRSLVEEGCCRAPTLLKIDVEGAEAEVLEGALPVVPTRGCILIALHSQDADRACSALVAAAGYETLPSEGLIASRRGPWKGDPDLLCLGPLRAAREEDVTALRMSGL